LERTVEEHRDRLRESVDAQAYRGRTGVEALDRARLAARLGPPAPDLHSYMEIAFRESQVVADGRRDDRPQ
jgi:hypothetical protein